MLGKSGIAGNRARVEMAIAFNRPVVHVRNDADRSVERELDLSGDLIEHGRGLSFIGNVQRYPCPS